MNTKNKIVKLRKKIEKEKCGCGRNLQSGIRYSEEFRLYNIYKFCNACSYEQEVEDTYLEKDEKRPIRVEKTFAEHVTI